jgi:RsiW-degrading membrane proteinase PrsW (M82 family)
MFSRTVPLALRLLILVCALFGAGCSVHLFGTDDLAITYKTAEPPPENLVALIRARLGAAQVTANVEATEGGAKVTVTRDESGTVDSLLSWRGGLAIYEVAPSASFSLPNAYRKGLELQTKTGSKGETERFYVGPQDVLSRALGQAQLGPGLKGLVERQSDGSSRSVLVKDPPLVDLTSAIASAVAEERSVAVSLSPYGESSLKTAVSTLAGTPVVIARDRSVLASEPLAEGPMTLSFGDDLAAFVTARTIAALLSSAPLPTLTRATTTAVPANWTLAIAALVVPFLLSLAWLFFVRRFDRAQPEPWWLVLATFFLGCLSVIPAALAELGWMGTSEWLDPALVTMGGMLSSLPLALPVFALVIGLSEEGSKFLGAWSFAFHRREFDEPIDGIVYGAASSLGFAAVENVKYFAVGRMTPSLVVIRMFMSVPAHLFFGAIWGYALGRSLIVPRTRIVGYVVLAALAHGAFDTLLSYGKLAVLAGFLNLALATLFVLLLRQSLRHGVVTRQARLVDPNLRSLYPVGSAAGFAASVFVLHTLALAIFVASAYAAGGTTPVGLGFVAVMSILLLLLGATAYLLSVTMPLDVVLDDYGVTFAGAARTWSSIRAIDPSPRGIHLRSTDGDIWIGPAAPQEIARVGRAIAKRLGWQPRQPISAPNPVRGVGAA